MNRGVDRASRLSVKTSFDSILAPYMGNMCFCFLGLLVAELRHLGFECKTRRKDFGINLELKENSLCFADSILPCISGSKAAAVNRTCNIGAKREAGAQDVEHWCSGAGAGDVEHWCSGAGDVQHCRPPLRGSRTATVFEDPQNPP